MGPCAGCSLPRVKAKGVSIGWAHREGEGGRGREMDVSIDPSVPTHPRLCFPLLYFVMGDL